MPGTGKLSKLAKHCALLVGAALVAAACAPATQAPTFPISSAGAKFLSYVPDSLNDAGRGASVVLDKDGNPVVSYLMVKAVLGPTDIPPAVKAGDPQPPAVMLASLSSNGLWSRTSVTPQLNSPRQGDKAKLLGGAFEIANDQGQAIPGVNTSLALDSAGKRHLAWATPTGVFYATDASGAFQQETVTKTGSVGASIAVGADGSPWISYVTAGGLEVATKTSGKWKGDHVADFSNLQTPGLATAVRVTSGGDPVVAFGDGTKTMVARKGGKAAGGWTVETVPGNGGLGVSMALDANGNPHLAYYDANGGVHHAHSLGGAPWTVNDLGTVSPGSNPEQAQAGWGTGIALDDKGVHYVTWADTANNVVQLATNASGQFAPPQPVPTSQGGLTPNISVSGDGKKLVIAWFDSVNKDLNVATAGAAGGLALAFSPAPAPSVSASASAAQCQPDGTALSISAPSAAGFDKQCLAAKAGTAFTVELKNTDPATPHNWELFTDSSGATRLGGANGVTDPVVAGSSATYKITPLQPGSYFYRCDFHPTTMTGTFVVAKG